MGGFAALVIVKLHLQPTFSVKVGYSFNKTEGSVIPGRECIIMEGAKSQRLLPGGAMKKRTLVALILIALGFGYLYMSNPYSSTPLEAIEKVRYEINDRLRLLHEIETDRGKVLFLLRDLPNGQTLDVEYVQKTLLFGWKWGYGGGHTLPSIRENDPDSSWTEQFFASTKGTKYDSPFPLLFGVINNPKIEVIDVYSYATDESFTASVKETGDPELRIWYLFVSEEQGTRFMLTAQTEDRQIISTKILEEITNQVGVP
jgi:hypothetical protein